MGSYVTLSLGKLELTCEKNGIFNNHSVIFQRGDYKTAPYFYADNIVEERKAFVCTLLSTLRRLELLGFSLAACEDFYNKAAATMLPSDERPFLSFAEFTNSMRNIPVHSPCPREGDDDTFDGFGVPDIFRYPEFFNSDARLANLTYSEREFLQHLELQPYLLLRLLAENPANLAENVIWRTNDVVEGGWVSENELHGGVSSQNTFLVVTEGSSDGNILRLSLPIVAPDIADFFDFVDMTENYPFTGTGNLYRFCQGLARIGVQNQILVVLDNDTAGREIERRILSEIVLPPNMRVTVLPSLHECEHMKTLGPSGENREDINGRAVAIECFLDFTSVGCDEPIIRWTSYNNNMGAYQGEVLQKEAYTKAFLNTVKQNGSYDYSKLAKLWDHLVRVCASPQNSPSVGRRGNGF